MLSGRLSEHDLWERASPRIGSSCERGRKTGSVEPDRARARKMEG
jgi:hypothetical protein